MADEHVPDEDTIQVLGEMGNIYEENPSAQHEVPLIERLLAEPTVPPSPNEHLAAAAKKLAADPAAPDHGKPAGAANALMFHTWDTNTKALGDDDQTEDGDS